jgi:hypothetical protein
MAKNSNNRKAACLRLDFNPFGGHKLLTVKKLYFFNPYWLTEKNFPRYIINHEKYFEDKNKSRT